MNRINENITFVSPFRFFAISLLRWLNILGEIVKVKITVLVSLTTALGYFLGTNKLSLEIFYPVIGIFILACGSAALNHYQERDADALMNRTRSRPIPTGKINANSVLLISFGLLVTGSVLLILKTNVITLIIGLLAFFWYNVIYTPLKKKMVFAIIPGSVVGALPPLAGWAATGNNIFDINILYIALYFFVWQIPHFWLLLLIFGNDYEKGGFPVITNRFDKNIIINITVIMLVSTVFIAALFPVFNLLHYSASSYILWFSCLLMIIETLRFLFSDYSNKNILKTFVNINLFTLLIITILSLDKIIYLAR